MASSMGWSGAHAAVAAGRRGGRLRSCRSGVGEVAQVRAFGFIQSQRVGEGGQDGRETPAKRPRSMRA